MNNPIIIDVEWREVSCSTEAVFEPNVMVQKQKWNKVDKVIFTLFYSIITFIVLRFMYGCYTNYMFWSEHDGVTLHKVLFGMPSLGEKTRDVRKNQKRDGFRIHGFGTLVL